jgi:glycosyltransferase involved in cell wall biosynthesis
MISKSKKPRLLVLVDWYLPGYKAGGQIQSCANLTAALRNTFDIFVLTSDRDLGEDHPYKGITTNAWTESPYGYSIYYLSPEKTSYRSIKTIIQKLNAETLYLNSMFSLHFTIMALVAAVYTSINIRIILAPRGMLHEGALRFKSIKKQFFLKAFRLLRLQKNIIFHATDRHEEIDIKTVFGKKANIRYVNDFPAMMQPQLSICSKVVGELNCLFISRISPKKNLLYLLEHIGQLSSEINLTIIGPVEDKEYWDRCQKVIRNSPKNITVSYLGAIPNSELTDYYRSNHLFILPTYGENFGHVIFESLLCGRPVLISDQTPWKDLQNKNVGWSLPLSASGDFINALKLASNWDQQDFDLHCRTSWRYAEEYLEGSELKEEYIKLFA